MNRLLYFVAMAIAVMAIYSCSLSVIENKDNAQQEKISIALMDSSIHVSPVINFKFSINGEDNEMQPETRHRFICIPHHGKSSTPVISFGELYMDTLKVPDSMSLLPNTRLTFRVNMSEVFTAFRQVGYYVSKTNSRIEEEDFKGVFVAGDIEPLNWEFNELANNKLMELKDEDGDGIYEGTVVF